MFSLKDFIMKTLHGMVNNYPDFQVTEYALNWYSKGKITEEDLATVDEWIVENNQPAVEEVVEDEESNTEEEEQ